MPLNAKDGLVDAHGEPIAPPEPEPIRPLPEHKCYHLEACLPDGTRHYYIPDPALYKGCMAGRIGNVVEGCHLYQHNDKTGKLTFDEHLTFVSVPIIYDIVDEPIWWHLVLKREKRIKPE